MGFCYNIQLKIFCQVFFGMNQNLIKQNFAKKLSRLMYTHGISEKELSQKTNLSQPTINRLRKAQISPQLFQAKIIADVFGCLVDDFLRQQEDYDYYVPVLSTHRLVFKHEIKVNGFYKNNEKTTWIGLKSDKSVHSKLFNKDTVILIKKIETDADRRDGDIVLFKQAHKILTGSIAHRHKIIASDDLSKSYDIDSVVLLGKIMKIQTHYITDKSLISNIKRILTKKRIEQQVHEQLSPVFAL